MYVRAACSLLGYEPHGCRGRAAARSRGLRGLSPLAISHKNEGTAILLLPAPPPPTLGMRGSAISCIRRSLPSRVTSGGGLVRSSVGVPANQMKRCDGVSRGISSTQRRQYVAAATRCALASEVSSLRFSAVVSGPEAGIPRGWDEGVDDDDGG